MDKICKISDDEYMQHIDALKTQLYVFAAGGSGWVVKTLSRLAIKTVCCNNVSCWSHIETPALLKPLKRSLLNVVKKRDNFCCWYCVAATLFFFTGKLFRPTAKKNIKKLCFNPKPMPMLLSAILLFEKRNHCSINYYQLENTKLVSVYYSKSGKGRYKIDLLRLLETKNSHYCLIKVFLNLLHFLNRSKAKQNEGPKSRFC